jgi:hypothetical protein
LTCAKRQTLTRQAHLTPGENRWTVINRPWLNCIWKQTTIPNLKGLQAPILKTAQNISPAGGCKPYSGQFMPSKMSQLLVMGIVENLRRLIENQSKLKRRDCDCEFPTHKQQRTGCRQLSRLWNSG